MSFNSLEFCDVYEIAADFVTNLISSAVDKLSRDRPGYFIYKCPELELDTSSSYTSGSSREEADPVGSLHWVTIQRFSYLKSVHNIHAFVNSWVLTPGTKFAVITHAGFKDVEGLGTTFFVDVIFSKPTQACPNPLATVTVSFQIHLSMLVPLYYPAMVTYTFENFGTIFYAFGKKSFDGNFQKYFIDNILDFKLKFFEDSIKWSHEVKEKERIRKEESCDDDMEEDNLFGRLTLRDGRKTLRFSEREESVFNILSQKDSSDDSENMKCHRPPEK
ncbi:uncharacterized protein LOC119685138 [Teleopsis dalmanni]|uniref:uncharacterized protein LOC119685138 n=1 Tax=Teleopsis dalmanni TaxID=139649 RepID=UPI0018CF6F39|nr:uncharacterized protein LOC119685138 [Teleopsis dalmanni]